MRTSAHFVLPDRQTILELSLFESATPLIHLYTSCFIYCIWDSLMISHFHQTIVLQIIFISQSVRETKLSNLHFCIVESNIYSITLETVVCEGPKKSESDTHCFNLPFILFRTFVTL